MTRPRTAAFAALLLALCLVGIGRDLWTPDEPREAEISREMSLAPSVVPSLNGEVFVEKPPLYYWTVAAVFRLVGEPSAPAARAVSVAASFLTLLLVFFWGRREFSTEVGVAAALGLATSAQFMISSHWVLIDPLLMLFTTVALWAASRLVHGNATRATATIFFAAVALALWTKGLIGPILVASGLLAYAVARRSFAPLRRVHPFVSVAVVVAATAVFAGLIGLESGYAAVREWFWVNHVDRFVAPTDATGHDQPYYYYLSAIPIAVLPWLVPFGAALRPRTWRRTAHLLDATHDKKVFLGCVSLGMALVLSASATKRGLYLLPMLPPLFLALAAIACEWWKTRPAGPLRGWLWPGQVACLVLYSALPVAVVLAYRRSADPLGLTFLAVVAALAAAAAIYARSGDRRQALAGVVALLAASTVVGLLGVTARLAAPLKDLTPFVAAAGEQIPSASVYVVGDFDETIRGIVPFVTGRTVLSIRAADLAALRPEFVLVQAKDGNRAPVLPRPYELRSSRRFGGDRYLALWARAPTDVDRLSDAGAPPGRSVAR